MINLFNYYDLKIHFRKKDKEPLHVYGRRGENYSRADILFSSGLFDKITIHELDGHTPLDEMDTNKMQLLILNNLDEVIKRWIDYYLYDKEVKEEIIQQKIEYSPFAN